MTDARELYRIALTILTDIERMFIDGLGADPTHMKAAGQFATDVDLAIEQYLRRRLIHETGIPVLGEEYGGDCGKLTWVVDPIDGTANFAAGNPMSCILISLLVDGMPVLAITSRPSRSAPRSPPTWDSPPSLGRQKATKPNSPTSCATDSSSN